MVFVNPPATITEPYEEVSLPQKSGALVMTLTSYESTRYFKCAWSDRLTLADKLRGSVTGSGNGIDIIYTQPHVDPDASSAVVVRVAVDPFTDNSDTESLVPPRVKYDYALLTVNYSTAALQLQEGGAGGIILITEDLEPWAEYLTIPSRSLYWNDGTKVSEEESPPLLVKGLTWVYRTHFQQSVPQAVLGLIGKVNDSQLTSTNLGLTFAEQTLLFTPPRMSIATDANGNRLIDIEYRFVYRPDTWNKFFNSKQIPAGYALMFLDAGGTQPFTLYDMADFSVLTG